MSERKFKIGDVVMLQSGGPKMTVIRNITGQVFIECQFFNGSEFETKKFHEDSVKKF